MLVFVFNVRRNWIITKIPLLKITKTGVQPSTLTSFIQISTTLTAVYLAHLWLTFSAKSVNYFCRKPSSYINVRVIYGYHMATILEMVITSNKTVSCSRWFISWSNNSTQCMFRASYQPYHCIPWGWCHLRSILNK